MYKEAGERSALWLPFSGAFYLPSFLELSLHALCSHSVYMRVLSVFHCFLITTRRPSSSPISSLLCHTMSSQHTTPNGSPTHHPNAKTPQPEETLPPGGISGKYRNENLPKPIHLYDAMYVLSREGNIWPDCEQYNGVLGLYTSLENAKTAGDRWLRKPPGLHLDRFDSSEIRISEWKVSDKNRDWVKQKGEIGKGFLESRVVRIKKCKVRTDSSLPEEPEDEDGKDEEKKDPEQKDHEDDEQDDMKEMEDISAVEGMKRLAV